MSWEQIANNFNLNICNYVTPIVTQRDNYKIYEFKTPKHALYVQLHMTDGDIYADVILHPFIKHHKRRIYQGWLREHWLLQLIYQTLNQYFIKYNN
jgi:hypothetical protein